MDEMLKPVDLSYLSEQIRLAAKELVSLKLTIDMAARENPLNIPRDLHGIMSGGEYGPHFGQTFFCRIIPFFPQEFKSAPAAERLVPTAYTFGCSWRWWPDRDSTQKDEHKIRHHIFSDFGLKSTSYTFIPQLGLFCPEEGKNRVNFCRHHNIEYIPARVYSHDYAEAEQISLYVLDLAGGLDVWAVLDNQYAQKITHISFALPLLHAYGVTIYERWPAEWPTISELLANKRDCSDSSTFHRPVIDIKAVRDLLEQNELCRQDGAQLVKTSVLELPLAGAFRSTLITMFLCIVSLLTYVSLDEGSISQIALGITTFLAGAVTMLCIPVFRVKKKIVKNSVDSKNNFM